jgi:hypothetical protein
LLGPEVALMTLLATVLFFACAAHESGKSGDDSDSSTLPPPPEGAELAELSLSQGKLSPPFRPDQYHYAVESSALVDAVTTITAVPGDAGATVDIVHSTMDGAAHDSGPSPLAAPLAESERVDVTVTLDGATSQYSIVSTPPTFPQLDVRVATEDAWDGYLFIGDFPTGSKDGERQGAHLFILDRMGVPVWLREIGGPGLDFKVNPNGLLTYIGLGSGAGGFVGYVLDDQYATVETLESVGGTTNSHELRLLENGNAIVLSTSVRQVDLGEYGKKPDCCAVIHYTFQELDAERHVVFEWSSESEFDELFQALPAARRKDLTSPMDYSHINSLAIDPSDGNWIIGSRFASQVMKIARNPTTFEGVDYAPGEMIWKLGGIDSDWTIAGDDRAGGWKGFAMQHNAVMPSANRLMVYDNSYWDDIGVTGDSRYVEYELDSATMTATKVSEYALEGSADTPIGGSVEKLPDGSHVIGWGALNTTFDGAPAVTEVNPDGDVVLEVALPYGDMSYRVGVGSWDPEQGWSVPE